MIGKVLRGTRHDRLIYYLYGPGRANEHIRPHIVAGWRHPAELEPPLRPDGRRDFRRLNGLLAQPLAALRGPGYGKPVWHCIARAAPGDPDLPDDAWAEIASQLAMHCECGCETQRAVYTLIASNAHCTLYSSCSRKATTSNCNCPTAPRI